jgi:hypothetical protein
MREGALGSPLNAFGDDERQRLQSPTFACWPFSVTVATVLSRQMGPPPGWFPDPEQEAGYRWWDGVGWSSHIFPTAGGQPGDREQDFGESGLRGLKIVSRLTLLAIPVDLVILHWVNAVANRKNCYGQFPSLPAHVGLLVPTLFGFAALVCLFFGVDAVTSGRRQRNHILHSDGKAVVALSVLGVIVAIGSVVVAWLIQAFSSMCFL